MVEILNRPSPVTPPSTINASRGVSAPRFDALFGNIGRAVGKLTAANEEAQNTALENEISDIVESSNESVLGGSPPVADGLNPEINAGINALQNINRAREQGIISEADAHARIRVRLKQLKSRYPSRRAVIDKAAGKLISSSASSREVRARLKEQKFQLQRQDKQLAREMDLRSRASKVGISEQRMRVMAPEDLERTVLQVEANRAQVRMQNQDLELRKSRNEAVSTDALQILTQRAAQAYNFGIDDVTTRLVGSREKFMTFMDEARKSDNRIDDKEREQLINMLNEADLELEAVFRGIAETPLGGDPSSPTLSSLINDQSKVNKIQADFIGRHDKLKKLLHDRDYGVLHKELRDIEFTNSRKLSQFKRIMPVHDWERLIKEKLGQDQANLFQVRFKEQLNNEQIAMKQQIIGSIVAGDNTVPLAGAMRQANASGESAIFHKQTLDQYASMIRDPNIGDDNLRNLVTNAYEQNLIHLLSDNSVYDETSRKKIFYDFISPAATKNISNLADTDPGVLAAYQQFVEEGFNSIFGPSVGTLADAIGETASFDVVFNARTAQFEVNPNVAGAAGLALNPLGILDSFADRSSFKAVEDVNKFLKAYKPIIIAAGGNEEDFTQAVTNILRRISPEFDPNRTSPSRSIAGRLAIGLKNWISGGKEQTPEGNPFDGAEGTDNLGGSESSSSAGQTTGVSSVLSVGESALQGAIAIGEGTSDEGGYGRLLSGFERQSGVDITQMTVDELLQMSSSNGAYGQFSKRTVGRLATPMGKYQIVGNTLKSLKEELGLSGSEQFTSELQDTLFLTLLNRRGYQQFQSGKLSAEAFLNRLKPEWAGLVHNQRSAREALRVLQSIAST